MTHDAGAMQAAMDKFLRGRDALTVPEQQGLDYNVQYIVESEYAAGGRGRLPIWWIWISSMHA